MYLSAVRSNTMEILSASYSLHKFIDIPFGLSAPTKQITYYINSVY